MRFICPKCGAEVYLFTDMRLNTKKLCSKCMRAYERQSRGQESASI